MIKNISTNRGYILIRSGACALINEGWLSCHRCHPIGCPVGLLANGYWGPILSGLHVGSKRDKESDRSKLETRTGNKGNSS